MGQKHHLCKGLKLLHPVVMIHTNADDRPDKVRITFLLNHAERQSLQRVCADRGAPLSELIRRSIAFWLREQQAESAGAPRT